MHTEQQSLKEKKNNSSASFVQISLTFDLSREKFKPIVSINNPGLFSMSWFVFVVHLLHAVHLFTLDTQRVTGTVPKSATKRQNVDLVELFKPTDN